MRISRIAAMWIGACLIASCGGGGGDPEGDPGFLPVPTGRVEGRITFLRATNPTVVETEPNDTVQSTQRLPDAFAGDSRSVFGRLDSSADAVDAFRLRLPFRTTLTATLRKSAADDFDLALYDPVSMQFIALADGPVPTHLITYQGALDILVIANAGEGIYELTFSAGVPFSDLPESEPNDTPQTATPFGELPVGESLRILGAADATSDLVDALLVLTSEQSTFDFLLTLEDGAEFSLRVSDATAGVGAATELTTLTGVGSTPRQGTLGVQPGTLLLLEVLADNGTGTWTLDVNVQPPGGSPKPGAGETLQAPTPRVAGAAREAAWWQRPTQRTYGTLHGSCMPGEALLAYCEGREAEGRDALRRRGCTVTHALEGVYCKVDFELPAGADDIQCQRQTFARAALLASQPCMRFAEPNHIRHQLTTIPNDTDWERNRWNHDIINLPYAWDITTGSNDVIVAIVDTGKIPHHPDLDARWIGGYDFVTVPAWQGDGDGLDPNPDDIESVFSSGGRGGYHGGGVASVIGAHTNNNEGMAGVTWATRLMPVRVLGVGGWGTDVEVIEGVRYAARLANSSGTLPPERADVINLSLGSPNWGQALEEACVAAKAEGCTLVAAAGNNGNNSVLYPAGLDATISVGGVSPNRARTGYSNFGDTLTLVAPAGLLTEDTNGDGFGDGVWTATGYPGPNGTTQTTFYQAANGTSFSAPHVAGLAALMLAVDPTLTPDQIESVLIATATDLGVPGRDDFYGHGLIDALAALEFVRGPVPPPPPAPPELVLTPPVLAFGAARFAESSYIRNNGVDPLVVSAPEVSTEDGENWLTATLVGPGDLTKNASRVDVQVNRAGLAEGSYFGEVTVRSNGGDLVIPVVMEVIQGLAPPPDLPIHVQAISVETGQVVSEVTVNPITSLDFVFAALAIGEYVFVASTDIDRDGQKCEIGDFCGGFPIQGDLQTLRVVRNFALTHVDFTVRRDAVPDIPDGP